MSRMPKRKHERKKWLSRDPCEGGAIRIHFEACPDLFGEGGPGVVGSVIIQDCGKQISLDFFANSKRGLDARMKKMQVLIDELQATKDWLEEQKEWLD